MANVFDQFDEPAPARGGGTITVRPYREAQPPAATAKNFFDQYDEPTGASAPDIGVVEDIAKSFPSGVARGAAITAGFPGDVGSAIGSAARRVFPESVVNAVSTAARHVPLTAAFAAGPKSEDIRSVIESVAGPLHEPQTTAGEYARTIGEFLPAAVTGPGGVVRSALRYGVLPAIASETAGQATKGTEAEHLARIAAAIGTGGATALLERPRVVPKEFTGQTNMAPEFNIPLSRGQAGKSVTDQITEQAALRGGLGPQVQQSAQEFFDAQRAAAWARNGRETIQVALDQYQSRDIIDVRTWYSDGVGTLRPTRSGVSLAVRHLPALADALTAALLVARERGLLPDDGGAS
ncbi:MAG: PC4/YdbC family ssDNA-binding protein [Rhodoplanes sp.]